MPFFVFGVSENSSGDIVYRGNYTDLSYHLSIISSFLHQPHFLPGNPQCAGAKMSYHFMVNFHTAVLSLGGIDLLYSVIISQILFAFCLATTLYSFFRLLLSEEKAVLFSCILFIMGHIGFFNILFGLMGYLPPGSKTGFKGVKTALVSANSAQDDG